MKIVTLTLNPAFDMHCHISDFKPLHENLAEITDFNAGGKGINISRALTQNGIENTAIVVLGDQNCDDFRKKLTKYGIAYKEIVISGRIRENITIHTDTADETRISFKGFSTDNKLLLSLEKLLKQMGGEETILTLTGRLPEGIDISAVKAFLSEQKKSGNKIVIDSRSFSVKDLTDVQPWLIKPNSEEISEYLGTEITDFSAALAGAKSLCDKGIENVMVSLGSKGSMLVNRDAAYVAAAPQVTVKSTVGAGDSSIAGFLAALKIGKAPHDCLKYAVAYGSAACETSGTTPPNKATIKALLNEIKTDILE